MLNVNKLIEASNMSDADLNRMADNLRTIALFFAKEELKKALLRKTAKLDQGRKHKLDPYTCDVVRKSIEGQDSDSDVKRKWPSFQE